MDDPELMAVVHCLAYLLEHLHDQTFVEQLVPTVPLNPLQEVAPIAVLHHYHHTLGRWDWNCLEDLHHVNIVNLRLDLHLWVLNNVANTL